MAAHFHFQPSQTWKHTRSWAPGVRVTALAFTQREGKRSGAVLVINEMKRGVKSTEGDRFLWSHGTCTITARCAHTCTHTHTHRTKSNLSALLLIHSALFAWEEHYTGILYAARTAMLIKVFMDVCEQLYFNLIVYSWRQNYYLSLQVPEKESKPTRKQKSVCFHREIS